MRTTAAACGDAAALVAEVRPGCEYSQAMQAQDQTDAVSHTAESCLATCPVAELQPCRREQQSLVLANPCPTVILTAKISSDDICNAWQLATHCLIAASQMTRYDC